MFLSAFSWYNRILIIAAVLIQNIGLNKVSIDDEMNLNISYDRDVDEI